MQQYALIPYRPSIIRTTNVQSYSGAAEELLVLQVGQDLQTGVTGSRNPHANAGH